jgi:Arc/MetJ family transcription regulator
MIFLISPNLDIQLHICSTYVTTRKTSLEVDVELLDEVRRALGTTTLKETVEEAFLEVLRERARREEIEALQSMSVMELDDPEVMAGAWRT